MEKGYLALLMHAHLPYVRHTEYKDSLEENWLYEATTDCYIPLLCLSEELTEQGIDFRLTITITPTLASMLADSFLQDRYVRKLKRLIQLAGKEVRRTRSDSSLNALARMYRERFCHTYEVFVNRYDRNLLQAFARLQQAGKIELIASAATHGYLPLLSVAPSSVRAQIRIGIESYREFFGRDPKGFWLRNQDRSTAFTRPSIALAAWLHSAVIRNPPSRFGAPRKDIRAIPIIASFIGTSGTIWI
jgi:1,4-alpha-glucan branching enzyme